MSVESALKSRKSVRAFLPDPLPRDEIEEMLQLASRAPSGGNLQPWFVYLVEGDAKDRLIASIQAVLPKKPQGEGSEFPIYPEKIADPYKSRRLKVAMDMYDQLGIERSDKIGRAMHMVQNFSFFGAPVGMFFAIDRSMAQNQWGHLGMFINSLCLLAEERGYGTCLQEAWAVFPKTVGSFLALPEEQMLVTGLALGREDKSAAVNALKTERAPLKDFLKVIS